MSFTILGTGSATPSLCKTNEDLVQIMDTSDEWIRTRTGIEQRYIMGEESITDLICQAVERALANAGLAPSELDLIICACITGDYITPATACIVQERLGASCPAFDVGAACCGFLYGLDVAAGYFARGRVGHVLVIGAEAVSRVVDWRDRSTAVIFADGAGAVVLGPGEDLLAVRLTTRGNHQALYAKHIQGNCPFRQRPEDPDGSFLHMDGQEVFRFAVASMVRDLKAVMKEAGLVPEDVAYVLPHQANLRIIDFAISKIPIPAERFLVNIHKHGNTSAAAIPILMDESNRKGLFRQGDILLCTTFGAGLTTAACALRWGTAQAEDRGPAASGKTENN